MNGAVAPWPIEIKYSKARRVLSIKFDDGSLFQLTAEYLRVESPSAEVQGHGAAQKQTVSGKRNVEVRAIEPVGRYAVRIVFNDGHDTGLFSWAYLHELGRERSNRWADYERRLRAARLTRDD
ncbi:MAG: DUF971 domain-containing protein [Alphaproteobacteria bacterium]|nr:DUF971 domain-containing protein [Alphaproteobacteria bacterium]